MSLISTFFLYSKNNINIWKSKKQSDNQNVNLLSTAPLPKATKSTIISIINKAKNITAFNTIAIT